MSRNVLTESKAIEILNRHRERLFAIPNVTSCGIGRRIRNGIRTNQLCIQCTVETKMSPEELEVHGIEPLPEQLQDDGRSIDVDVVQRSFEPHYRVETAGVESDEIDAQIEPAAEVLRRDRLDPIAPGCSVGNVHVSAGTLGAVVFDAQTGAPLLLSNWHVLQGANGEIGDAVVQPGRHDDPNIERNRVGTLLRSHLGLTGDCAVASLRGREFDPAILELGVVPRRTATVNLEDRVVKSGRTTGVTYGFVTRIGVTARINYRGEAGVQTIGCFEIGPNSEKPSARGEVSEGGDSGSLWLIDTDSEDRDIAVGLHFAGESDPSPSAEHALACPIGTVLQVLDASLVPPIEPMRDDVDQSGGLVRRIERLESLVLGAAAISPTDNRETNGSVDDPVIHFSDDDLAVLNSVLEANDSNRNEVRAGVESGGWDIVWGVTVNEAEYAKFIAACAVAVTTGNVGALTAYFQDYLERSIDKFQHEAPGIARDALVKTVIKALNDRGQTFRVGRIGAKGGIATYRRWYTVTVQVPDGMERYKKRGPFGSWTWAYRPKFRPLAKTVPLPNHHQPYVGFRLY